jgi:pimeloyl-ACP methyl ester carboxylesterase
MTSLRTRSKSRTPDPASSGSIRESFARADDGTKLYVRERDLVGALGAPGDFSVEGDAAAGGVTGIFCDGLVCDGYIWKYLWDDLATEVRLVHWNYRGHGRSALPQDPDRIDIAAHASDLDCVRRHTGDGPVVLFGHSMGCQVVLEAYRRRPASVRAIVLICGSSGRVTETFHGSDVLARVLPRVLKVAEARPALMRALWSRIPVQTALKVALATGEVGRDLLDPDDLIPYLEHVTHMDFLLFLRMLKAAGEHSAEDMLASVDVPTLVVAGERDTFTPRRLAEDLSKALPRSELVVVPGGTHVAPLERRELVRDAVSRFLHDAVKP